MPTPHFAFRLPANEDAKLRELASLYYDGKPNMASQFVRELIAAAVSGDHSKVAEFFTRLQMKLTGQLELELKVAQEKLKVAREEKAAEELKAVQEELKAVQDRPKGAAKPRLKRKRKGGRHVRPTR